jgi:superfamily I DNA and/or RNA helicase
LFQSLFQHGQAPRGFTRPTGTLTTQYRMLEPIGRLVSNVFYPTESLVDLPPNAVLPAGRLKSVRKTPDVHLTAPRALVGRPLVWIDTAHLEDHGNQPRWWNPGEIRVVRSLVRQLSPAPKEGHNGYGPDPLAVLTPYRRQASEMKRDTLLDRHVSTVHAFQGRQADVVVVSLVRDTWQGGPGPAIAKIGHLVNPELANVLFSRARDHLVVVGDFEHFAMSGSPDWEWICAEIQRWGRVIDAREVIG